jgi:O-methyltransferase
MRGTNFRLCQGRFPDTAGMVAAGAKFVLAHIDCDLYAPAKAALEFFYPRLVPGGFLIVHDYSSNFWPGIEKAVDEFFGSSNRIVPMPDKAGSIVVRK